MHFTIKKGLDLPISGSPSQTISDAPTVTHVAALGPDFLGLKPTMMVREGDTVKLGQKLFEDKKNPGVFITAPGAGEITAVNRGAKRVLQSVVIKLNGDDQETFATHSDTELPKLAREIVQQQLIDSGLWTALRTRPYSKVPAPNSTPNAIFVTAMDSNPLALDPAMVIADHSQDFSRGLTILSRLTDGQVHVCKAAGANVTAPNGNQFNVAEFEGKHPAGLVGTHIHMIDPVGSGKTAWHLGAQDVIAIGKLFSNGKIWVERIVSLAGPAVSNPRLMRTRLGADLSELVGNDISGNDCRLISGSLFAGRRAVGWAHFLGRYHSQLCALEEGTHRQFMGWIAPGKNKFSVTRAFISQFAKDRKFSLTTTQNGSARAMVPIGNYERVMPLDILATQLLRALLVRDTDAAQTLGALELDEEDVALCTFVCVGKYDFGPVLRANLEQIEREG